MLPPTFPVDAGHSGAIGAPGIKVCPECGPRRVDVEGHQEDQSEGGEDGQQHEKCRRVEEQQVEEHLAQLRAATRLAVIRSRRRRQRRGRGRRGGRRTGRVVLSPLLFRRTQLEYFLHHGGFSAVN